MADDWQRGGLVLDSVAGALYGPNTNGALGAVAQVAAPHLVSELGDYFERSGQQGSTGHIVAQGALGAALAAATGNDALIGGLVSGGSEAFTPILTNWLYGTTNPSELTADQKSTVSAIVGLGTAGLTASTGADASTIASASSAAQNVAENNALKAAVTVTKIIYKAGKRVVKNGRIKMDDLKQIVKDEGLDILDNVMTLADGTLSWDDAKAVIDLVVGTSLNGASKGKALEKINEIVGNKTISRSSGPIFRTTAEAVVEATRLGYSKVNGTSSGQAVFYNSKTGLYITRDVDGHNGGAWKAAKSIADLGSKGTRKGTYDINMNRIGD